MERKNKKPPHQRCLVLIALRHRRGWTQDQLAEASGVSSKMISQYESGDRVPPHRRLLRFASAMGFGPEEVDCALFGLEAVCDAETPEMSALSLTERRAIRHQAALAGLAQARALRSDLLATARQERLRRERDEGEPYARQIAALATRGGATRQAEFLIAELPAHLAWAVVERLIADSLRAIVIEPRRALDLAELGCRVADVDRTGKGPWPKLQAHALAFRANALRVLGELNEADQTFKLAGRLLKGKGVAGGGPGLPAWRFLDLQASLRRDQRRFKETLALSGQALAIAPASALGQILLNQAFALQQMGEAERAIEMLRKAAPLVDGQSDPRLPYVLQFNLASNLVDLGRAAEAELPLGEAREIALDLGNEADVARCLWLGGRIGGALARVGEAVEVLTQARREFTALQLPCDAALAALDEAILRLQAGDVVAVRLLAEEIAWIFSARSVGREALAALAVFCEAARREEVTVAQAQRAFRALVRGI